MQAEDVGDELSGNILGGVLVSGRDEVGLLGELINNNKDRVMAIGEGKFDDVVGRDGGPGTRGDWKGREEAMAFMVWRFGSLAGVAGLDVVIDEVAHAWPVEIAGYDFEDLGLTKVTDQQ